MLDFTSKSFANKQDNVDNLIDELERAKIPRMCLDDNRWGVNLVSILEHHMQS